MKRIVTALALGTLLGPGAVFAQQPQEPDRWAFELRVAGTVPTSDLGEDQLGYSGFGFEGTFSYRFTPHLAAYAGWDWMHFHPEDDFQGVDLDFEETGYVLGLRWEHPVRGETGDGLSTWLRVGGTYDHVEMENDDGDIVADSGHGLGWEVGAGVGMTLGGAWRFTPGLRYRALDRDVEVGSSSTEMELRYVALEVGFARRF